MINNTLNHLPENSKVIIDTRPAKNIHPDVVEICDDFQSNAGNKNIEVEILRREKDSGHDPLENFNNLVLNKPTKKNKSNRK